MTMIHGIEVDYTNDVSVFPIKFWTDYKPVEGKAGEFEPVDKVLLAKRGTTGHETPHTINRLSRDTVIWPTIKPMYELWKSGEEEPVDGSPLVMCAFIHAAQIDDLRRLNIRTVEDLAKTTDADFERIGMGARLLRDKARAWLKDKEGSSAVAAELAVRDKTITEQQAQIDDLKATVAELAANQKKAPGRKPRDVASFDD